MESLSLGKKFLRYLKDPKVSVWRKLAGVWAGIYLVFPLDAVPDFIPLLGWLDDLGVVSVAAFFIVREVKRHAAIHDSAPKDIVVEGQTRPPHR